MSEKTNPSPYLDARREWEERYGCFVSAAQSWKITAFISLAIAFIATGGAIWLGGQKEVVPYIVEVDRSGTIAKVQPANSPDNATLQKIIFSQLAEFVEKARGVVLDARIQRESVEKVYAYLQKNTPAFTKVTEYFRKNDPFARARKETAFAEIINILPLKENAYQLEWRETVMDRKTGKTETITNYKLVAYTSISPPTNERDLLKNPTGLIINDLNWSKEL